MGKVLLWIYFGQLIPMLLLASYGLWPDATWHFIWGTALLGGYVMAVLWVAEGVRYITTRRR